MLEDGGSLAIPRYVKPIPPKASASNDGNVATAWAAFDENGREFWKQIDELIETLETTRPEDAIDVQ